MPSMGRSPCDWQPRKIDFFMFQRNGQEHSRSRCARKAIQARLMVLKDTVRQGARLTDVRLPRPSAAASLGRPRNDDHPSARLLSRALATVAVTAHSHSAYITLSHQRGRGELRWRGLVEAKASADDAR